MSVSTKMYFSDVLYIAISEITFYRYLLPESYFEDALFEGIEVHRILQGKSTESDMLLEVLRGVCDALNKDFLKTLTFGLSVHPTDASFIREIYAFQFKTKPVGTAQLLSQDDSDMSTGKALLFRLIALLKEMEDYTPPVFVPFPPSEINGYLIIPQFGSAQVGRIKRVGLEGRLCVVSVEGPVQQPPLGSTTCLTPVHVDLDADPDEQMFIAAPSAVTLDDPVMVTRQQQKRCIIDLIKGSASSDSGSIALSEPELVPKVEPNVINQSATKLCECLVAHPDETCKRAFHIACYELEGDLVPLVAKCLTCQAKDTLGIRMASFFYSRLALARRAARVAYRQKDEQVMWLIKRLGCNISKGRSIVKAINALGMVHVDKDAYPSRFHVAEERSWQNGRAVLFGSNLERAINSATPKARPRI
ncbi:hypothetical protein IWW55_000447 [Coemansia sp. RSA 2706]|nr:hypothetical protein IWW55_000447 [Coemansia sp. RSA 2706]